MLKSSGLGVLTVGVLLLFAIPELPGQQTTNTNCTSSGANTNCTSTTTDNSAQQQRAYETGQQNGKAIGSGIAAGVNAHAQTKWVRNYCAANPGMGWKWTRNSDGRVIS